MLVLNKTLIKKRKTTFTEIREYLKNQNISKYLFKGAQFIFSIDEYKVGKHVEFNPYITLYLFDEETVKAIFNNQNYQQNLNFNNHNSNEYYIPNSYNIN
jgi:hypothetical protein